MEKLRKAMTAEDLYRVQGMQYGIESFADRLNHLVNQGENAMAAIASSIPETD